MGKSNELPYLVSFAIAIKENIKTDRVSFDVFQPKAMK